MALIKCESCGKEKSDKAKKCPHCNHVAEESIFCPECGTKNKPGNTFCESCGTSLTEKTVEKKATSNNAGGNSIMDIIKNKYFIVGAVIVLLLVLWQTGTFDSIGIGGSSSNNQVEIYEDLLEASFKTEVLGSDLYNAWHYGIYEDYYSLSSLASELSLTSGQLTGSWCSSLYYSDDWNDVTWCVMGSHEDLGNYEEVADILEDVKDQLETVKDSEVKTNLEDLYKVVKKYLDVTENYTGSFNQLQDDLKDIRNEIEDLIEELDYELDFDSDDFEDNLDYDSDY